MRIFCQRSASHVSKTTLLTVCPPAIMWATSQETFGVSETSLLSYRDKLENFNLPVASSNTFQKANLLTTKIGLLAPKHI